MERKLKQEPASNAESRRIHAITQIGLRDFTWSPGWPKPTYLIAFNEKPGHWVRVTKGGKQYVQWINHKYQ